MRPPGLFERVGLKCGCLGGVYQACSSSSSAFASFRSRVSNPSVNQPYTGASQFASLLRLALAAQEARKAHRSAEFRVWFSTNWTPQRHPS